MLAGKHILIGVTGSIAAYQAADLIGLLKQQMASVRVIMTSSATRFITPLTLQVISEHPVTVEMFAPTNHAGVEHIAVATVADLLLIAPATADIIGKLANGIADDMLSTTALAVRCPVLIAPAMNEHMWFNPVVQANAQRLKAVGMHFVEPEFGPMACGGEGWGRLAGLDVIVELASALLTSRPRPKDTALEEAAAAR
jgi:phosphopantothenoylcysteine decarboxylase/phosphopantothenate--cysteine ligase